MEKSSLKTREKFAALGFVAPLFIGFALFTAVPLVVAVIYSLVDYMLLQGKISPVSFKVYAELFKGQLTMLDPVLHHQPGNVVPRPGDIVVAPPLAAVDLKGLVLPVPAVVLDVKVGEAGEVKGLQESFDFQL